MEFKIVTLVLNKSSDKWTVMVQETEFVSQDERQK